MVWFFQKAPESLAKKIMAIGSNGYPPAYNARVKWFNTLVALPASSQRVTALHHIALNDGDFGNYAVAALSAIEPPDRRIEILCDIVERGQHPGPVEAALAQLSGGPSTERVVDCLCALLRRRSTIKWFEWSRIRAHVLGSREYSQWKNIERHPKLLDAFIEAVSTGRWAFRETGQIYEDEDARILFSAWSLRFSPEQIVNAIIPEFSRRAIALPILYDHVRGGWLGQNRFELCLNHYQRWPESAAAAIAAQAAIADDLMRRRTTSVSELLRRAVTSPRYDEVAGCAKELEKLVELRAPGADAALAEFRNRPARMLPKREYENVDYTDYSGTATERRDYERLTSTANLGQRPS